MIKKQSLASRASTEHKVVEKASKDVSPKSNEKSDPQRHAFNTACRLLSRREYSAQELRLRLAQKDVPSGIIEHVLQRLQQQGWQSDTRFVEMFVSARLSRGYGPQRIAAELTQRGIADESIADYLSGNDTDWNAIVTRVFRKRFKSAPTTAQERAKAIRYLRQRGFSSDQIRTAMKHSSQFDEV